MVQTQSVDPERREPPPALESIPREGTPDSFLSTDEEASLAWLMADRPEPRSSQHLLQMLFFMARAGRNAEPGIRDVADASAIVKRSETDERLRWALPFYLVLLCILIMLLLAMDAAGMVEFKIDTLITLNRCLVGGVGGLLACIANFFFGSSRRGNLVKATQAQG